MVFDLLASRVYSRAVARRNRRFDAGRHVTHVECGVISVGNLTVGGTGKTPMTRWVVQTLADAGYHPAVALRGYGARDAADSDEAREHERLLGDTPILVGADRVKSVQAHLASHTDTDVVVLDDGFQHRFLARDLDIVLIDGRAPLASNRVLPAGRLREPLSSLGRADAVVVMHAEHACEDEHLACIERHHGRGPTATCEHVWSGVECMRGEGASMLDVNALEGCALVTRLGIADDTSVLDMIQACGARVVQALRARDHQRFTADEVRRLQDAAAKADGVLVTGKDWATLAPLVDWSRLSVPVYVPRLALSFSSGEDALLRQVRSAVGQE